MSEVKDPAIKLFGKTISMQHDDSVFNSIAADHPEQQGSLFATTTHDDKDALGEEHTESKLDDDSIDATPQESTEVATSSSISDEPRTEEAEKESESQNTGKEEHCETNDSQEKTLKKPDKILPCPRCNSMDTKFCYYNNYNVNQPRHFCKNCQRYWTAGGTMRNVPVGSGRRKNKSSSASSYRHIVVTETFQASRGDAPNGIHLPTVKANGTVLTFGTDRPLYESMASALNLADKSQNSAPNGFHGTEERIPVPFGWKEVGNDYSNGPPVIASSSTDKESNSGQQESALKNFQSLPPQVPCFPAPPWPCPWNTPQWGSPMPLPAFSPSGFPVSFYPATPYWGCAVPSPCNLPWISPAPSSPDHSALSTSPTSPNLGKHSRDGNMLTPSNLGKEEPLQEQDAVRSVLVPKTLRIDNPNEAAKSSIWSTLGIKDEKRDSISGAGLFKGFHSKAAERNHAADSSLVLHANPAALSRSLNFHERN